MKIKIKKPNQIGVKIHGKNIYPELENLVITPSAEEQKFKSESYGYNEVVVRAIPTEELVVQPSAEEQNFSGLFSSVKVNKVTGEILEVNPTLEKQYFKGIYTDITVNEIIGESVEITPSFEKQEKNGLFTNVTVNPVVTEDIEINPSFEEQNFSGLFKNIKANPIEAQEIKIKPTIEIQTKTGLFKKVEVEGISGESLIIEPSSESQKYNGVFTEVNVNPIEAEEITINPTKELQTKEGLFNKVNVNAIETEKLNVTPQKTPQEFNGLFDKVNVEAVEINLQEKTIEPTKEVQEVVADANYDGMRKITVRAIPDAFLIPTDNIAITKNGTYDVKEYETATVNVPISEPNLGTKEVTANGEYSASEDNLDGYSKVSVNIPIPEPNVASKTITENGTYNASDEGLDGFSSVEVNVASSGGGSTGATEKDVNFYTPYGDLVIGYTIEEAHALTELPQAPELPRLTFQEWNYSLEEVQTTNTKLDIGANYTTTSGETEFDVSVNAQSNMTVSFASLKGMTSVDWGDGTVDTNTSHTYTVAGDYTIIVYGLTSLATGIMNNGSTSGTAPKNYNLIEVRLSDKITTIPSYGFHYCHSLKHIIGSKNLKSHSTYCFRECKTLKYFVFSKATTSLNFSYGFYNCVGLQGVSIPSHITSALGSNFFNYCSNLKRLIFPKDMTTMSSSMSYILGQCYSLKEVIFASNLTTMTINLNSELYNLEKMDFRNCTSVPTISTATYLNTTNYTCKFLVPKNLLEEWKSATTWSTYANRIVGV